MQDPVDWRAQALRLRARGHDAGEIAALLGQAPREVLEALRGTRRTPLAALGAGASMVEPHVSRVPRPPLDRTVLQSAALAFAKGEISRDELLKRISRP